MKTKKDARLRVIRCWVLKDGTTEGDECPYASQGDGIPQLYGDKERKGFTLSKKWKWIPATLTFRD